MIPAECEAALRSAVVCTLGLALDGQPYAVPVSYGYSEGRLFFHGSGSGRKMDILRANPQASFCVVLSAEVAVNENPCQWSVAYKSLVGFGLVREVVDLAEKQEALDALMRQHARYLGIEEPPSYAFPKSKLEQTTVLCLTIDAVSLKER